MSQKNAVVSCLLLALNCGYMNGVCIGGLLNGAVQPSTAVTGAWTISAVNAAKGNTAVFAKNAKMILSYFGGSLLASLINPYPSSNTVNAKTGQSLIAGGALLALATKFAKEGKALAPFMLVAVVAGLQNSLTSVATGNLCRTAHFSGITSDLGTFAGQVLRGNKTNLYKLKVFAALGACFWMGGYLSVGVVGSMMDKNTNLMVSSVLMLLLGAGILVKG